MTVSDVAKLEHVSYAAVHRWIRCGALLSERLAIVEGGRMSVWIDPAEYQRFAQSQKGEHQAPTEKQRIARNRSEWR